MDLQLINSLGDEERMTESTHLGMVRVTESTHLGMERVIESTHLGME